MRHTVPAREVASGRGALRGRSGPALGLWLLAAVAAWGRPVAAEAVVWTETFDTPPAGRGWRAFGDADLFRWDAEAGALRVRWDSRRPNSYFFRPLGTELNRTDAFGLEFDLRLETVQPGVDPAKPFTFELAVGFHRRADAEAPGFRRGTGTGATNLVELAWFPDTGYGATLWPTVISAEGRFNYSGSTDFRILDLVPGVSYRMRLAYDPAAAVFRLDVTGDGQPLIAGHRVPLAGSFTDFRVDAVAVRSYSDDGAQGSLLAEGWIDNLSVWTPPPPVSGMRASRTSDGIRISARVAAGWRAVLERSLDGREWSAIGEAVEGNDGEVRWEETAADAPVAFYRLRAERP